MSWSNDWVRALTRSGSERERHLRACSYAISGWSHISGTKRGEKSKGVTSLVSKPHPQGGKRVWWLWTESLVLRGGISTRQSNLSSAIVTWLTCHRNATLCTKEFPSANQIIALAQSYDLVAYRRNVTALQLHISVHQLDLSVAWLVGACDSARTEDSRPKVTRPFSLLEEGGVWGRD